MRSVRYATEAQNALANQIKYLIDRQAFVAAEALSARVERYLSETLALFPGTGRYIASQRVWECWIPDTRLIA